MQTVHIREHGGPSVLQLVETPRPEPGPGEVLCRVLGLSVNHLDLWVRRGMPGVKIPMPHIPGCDGTGEVVACGDGVQAALEVGQPVLLEPGFTVADSQWVSEGLDHLADDYQIRGEHGAGYGREFVCLPERYVLPLPDGLDPVDTAATPLVFLTAWGLLHSRAQVRKGEHVLVLGGASGVGSAAIQVAREAGAKVIATAGRKEGRALSCELGADVALDHGDPDWGKQLRSWSPRGVDVVVEHVGPATWATSMRVLARNGRLVTCGGTTGPKVDIALPHLFMKNQSVLGSTMGPRNAFPTILERLASGAYKAVVDRRMPLSEVRQAHELLEDRGVTGKIVLIPGS
ncbi:MAG: NADPH:quinone reductase-like Zn-dependent oxidoreductase [Planctomycetota bacterium]|jgi:NADPH:quinone reductase-like Zn-dependent oxidoreductase